MEWKWVLNEYQELWFFLDFILLQQFMQMHAICKYIILYKYLLLTVHVW